MQECDVVHTGRQLGEQIGNPLAAIAILLEVPARFDDSSLVATTPTAKCLDCDHRYELQPIKEVFLVDETMPICDSCGSEFIKTATVSFGQAMPEKEMARAQRETLACDLFIAIGSSLVVYPAAGFPIMAKQNDAGMVILNREATDLDSHADLVINGEIGPTLGDAVAVN